MEAFLRDLNHSLRSLLIRPRYLVVSVLTLSLGIGLSALTFGVIDQVLLRPLTYEQPQRLVIVWETHREKGWSENTASYPNFCDWRDQNQVFETLGAVSFFGVNLTGDTEPARLRGVRISADLLAALGVKPHLGRVFLPEEDAAGAPPVAVLSHALWRRSFNSEANIIGRQVRLDGEPVTVVGVMPEGFQYPPQISFQSRSYTDPIDLWTPVEPSADRLGRGSRLFFVTGRLKDGVSIERAQSELEIIARRLAKQYPDRNEGWSVSVVSLYEQMVSTVRRGLWMLFGAVILTLVIAGANVVNLTLIRLLKRERELGTQVALGASAWQIVRRLVLDGLLLGLASGVLGLLLAKVVGNILIAMAGGEIPRLGRFTIETPVVVFTVVLCVLTGLALGLLGAVHSWRLNLGQVLKDRGASTVGGVRAHRLRRALVAGEIALAVVLLASAGAFLRGFNRLSHQDPGFHAEGVLTFEISLSDAKYSSFEQAMNLYEELVKRFEALPGVAAAGYTNRLPLGGSGYGDSFRIDDRAEPQEKPQAQIRSVSSNYFDTLGIRVLRGRGFTPSDHRDGPPVVAVNQALAEKYWPGGEAMGRRISVGPGLGAGRGVLGVDSSSEIVGIVRDVRGFGLDQKPVGMIYVPQLQDPWATVRFAVRSGSDPEQLAAAVRQEIWAVDKAMPVARLATMEDLVSDSVGSSRFRTVLLSVFALIALILSLVGIYGLVSFTVTQRTQEIGLRLSLGARPRDIVWLMVTQGMRSVGAGLLLGVVLALLSARLIASFVFGISGVDLLTLSVGTLLFLAMAVLANYFPTRRATAIDPVKALQHE